MDVREAMNKAAAAMDAAPAETSPEPAPAVESAPAPAAPSEAQKPAVERVRANDGTFAKGGEKPAPKATEKPEAPTAPNGAAPAPAAGQGKEDGAATPSAPSSAPASKPPQSLTPAEKEAWSKAPPEIQKAMERREREVSRALQESAEARKFAQVAQQTLAPFEGLARANGMDGIKYAGSVMQTAAALHMGTPVQKAQIVAQLIGTYGIDVDAVNAVMQGQAPQAPQHQAQPQPDVGQLVERAIQQRLAQATETKAVQAWQEFEASAPEFLDQVKDKMRVVLLSAGQEGRNMTYQQAYDLACRMDDEVSTVLGQRKAAQSVRTPQPVTEQQRAAASSMRTQPASVPSGKSKGIRGAMDAAAEKLGL